MHALAELQNVASDSCLYFLNIHMHPTAESAFYPLCMALVKAKRLLYGLRLRSLGAAAGALWAGTGAAE